MARTAYNGNYACGDDGIWRRVPTDDPVPGAVVLPDGRFLARELLPGELLDTAGAARVAGLQDPGSISRALATRDDPATVHPIPPPVDYLGHSPVWAAWAIRHWRATRPVRGEGTSGGWIRPPDAAAEPADHEPFEQVLRRINLPDDATGEQVRAWVTNEQIRLQLEPVIRLQLEPAWHADKRSEDPYGMQWVTGSASPFWAVYSQLCRQGCTPKGALAHAFMDLQTRVRSGRPLYPVAQRGHGEPAPG